VLSVFDRDDTDRDPVLPAFAMARVWELIVPSGRPLDPYERRAFADVVRIWLDMPLGPPASRADERPRRKAFGGRVTRRPRPCQGCGGAGVRLRFGNRCERCYRTLMEV
jgi:hypothetical protein